MLASNPEPSSGAYPLVQLTYGATAQTSLTQPEANDYAKLIRYGVGAGQVTGNDPGQLPFGYAPLPQNLRDQALFAAAIIESRKGGTSTTVGAPGPGGTTVGGTGLGGSGAVGTGDFSGGSGDTSGISADTSGDGTGLGDTTAEAASGDVGGRDHCAAGALEGDGRQLAGVERLQHWCLVDHPRVKRQRGALRLAAGFGLRRLGRSGRPGTSAFEEATTALNS